MNWEHFKAILWLRRRLAVNAAKRSASINETLLKIFYVIAPIFGGLAFAGSLGLGVWLLPAAEPFHVMLAWDALAVAFVFFYLIGLLVELQRSDPLSLDRLLHLPVSPASAFAINFGASLVRLPTLLFVPPMLGLAVAMVWVRGASALIAFPLIAGLVVMTAAFAYQFQGWIALLLKNKRRRGMVLGCITFGIVLVGQAPNLIGFATRRAAKEDREKAKIEKTEALAEVKSRFDQREIDKSEYDLLRKEITDQLAASSKERRDQDKETRNLWIARANQILPIGWLPYGASAAFEGKALPGIGGFLGLALIASLSLRRSYRTTLKYFRGEGGLGKTKAAKPQSVDTASPLRRPSNWLEKKLPWFSDTVSVVAMGSLRTFSRAPEAKMAMIAPIVLFCFLGWMLFTRSGFETPSTLRPLIATGGCSMILVGILTVMMNQFGFDREGFRAFAISPIDRRDILIGKNLSFVPLAAAECLIALAAVRWFNPMSVFELLGAALLTSAAFAIFCLIANAFSIKYPMRIEAGSMKPAKTKFLVGLLQGLAFLLSPLLVTPLYFPVGLLALADWMEWTSGPLLFLASSLAVAAGTWIFYGWAIRRQGAFLGEEERNILQVVANKAA